MATHKVHVPQKDGEIKISVAGAEATVWKVTDHTISVREDDLQLILNHVSESRVVQEKSKEAPEDRD